MRPLGCNFGQFSLEDQDLYILVNSFIRWGDQLSLVTPLARKFSISNHHFMGGSKLELLSKKMSYVSTCDWSLYYCVIKCMSAAASYIWHALFVLCSCSVHTIFAREARMFASPRNVFIFFHFFSPPFLSFLLLPAGTFFRFQLVFIPDSCMNFLVDPPKV